MQLQENPSNFQQIGNLKFNVKPQKLSSNEIKDLSTKIPSIIKILEDAKKIRSCYIDGFYLTTTDENKKADNSLMKIDNQLGKILKILLVKNEIFFLLEINYKIVKQQNYISQYNFLQKLSQNQIIIRKANKFESKVFFYECGPYFVIPPNTIECD